MTINDIICKLYDKATNAALVHTTRNGKTTTLSEADVSRIEIEGSEVKVYFECEDI